MIKRYCDICKEEHKINYSNVEKSDISPNDNRFGRASFHASIHVERDGSVFDCCLKCLVIILDNIY